MLRTLPTLSAPKQWGVTRQLRPVPAVHMQRMGDDYDTAGMNANEAVMASYGTSGTDSNWIGNYSDTSPQQSQSSGGSILESLAGNTGFINSLTNAATRALGLQTYNPTTYYVPTTTSSLPTWFLPAAVGLGLLMLMSGSKRNRREEES